MREVEGVKTGSEETHKKYLIFLKLTAFCTSAIFSGSTSRPRFPRDSTIPSAADAISAKLNSDWRVSSLARILVVAQVPPGTASRKSRAAATSSPERANDSDTKSTSNSAARAAIIVLSSAQSTGRSFCMLASPSSDRSVWNTVRSPPSDAALEATHEMASPSMPVTVR